MVKWENFHQISKNLDSCDIEPDTILLQRKYKEYNRIILLLSAFKPSFFALFPAHIYKQAVKKAPDSFLELGREFSN